MTVVPFTCFLFESKIAVDMVVLKQSLSPGMREFSIVAMILLCSDYILKDCRKHFNLVRVCTLLELSRGGRVIDWVRQIPMVQKRGSSPSSTDGCGVCSCKLVYIPYQRGPHICWSQSSCQTSARSFMILFPSSADDKTECYLFFLTELKN